MDDVTLKPHQELHPDGTPQGRDPRKMTPEDMAELGLQRISRGDAIRAHCIDCAGGSPAEVRRCAAIECALWGFRMGNDPFREAREMTEEQRQAGAERLRLAREARSGKIAPPKPTVSLFG